MGDEETIDIARQAVRTRVFPLIEVENGVQWRFSMAPPAEPVAPYLRRQGRFRHLGPEQIEHIQREVDGHWAALERRVRESE
jgi:pyruvate/2-oxoacid:ferredoxin oxidoreductase beta subunit